METGLPFPPHSSCSPTCEVFREQIGQPHLYARLDQALGLPLSHSKAWGKCSRYLLTMHTLKMHMSVPPPPQGVTVLCEHIPITWQRPPSRHSVYTVPETSDHTVNRFVGVGCAPTHTKGQEGDKHSPNRAVPARGGHSNISREG